MKTPCREIPGLFIKDRPSLDEEITPLQTELLKIFRHHPAFEWSEKDFTIVLWAIKATHEEVREALRTLADRRIPLAIEVYPCHWKALSRSRLSFALSNN